MRQTFQLLAAGATFTRVLEVNLAQEATLPQIPNLRTGTPLNTTRNLILVQKVLGILLLVLTVSNTCDFVLSLLY
jgi:hypothetical protein